MRLRAAALAFVLAGCALPGPGPAPKPNPAPVTPVSNCKEVFPTGGPSGYTRPTPTNHPLFILPSLPDYTGIRIIWLDRGCDRFFTGPLDYRYPGTPYCSFHPDEGDRIYSAADGFIIPIPAPCGRTV